MYNYKYRVNCACIMHALLQIYWPHEHWGKKKHKPKKKPVRKKVEEVKTIDTHNVYCPFMGHSNLFPYPAWALLALA